MPEVWDAFMKRLLEEDKLDEFVKLEADDIDSWLTANKMGVSLDQLATDLPKKRLDDDELDNVAGGKIVIQRVLAERNSIL